MLTKKSIFPSQKQRQKIMILGAGTMQLPVIYHSNLLGLHSIVVDGDKDAPGKASATEFYHIDLKDIDALIKLAKSTHIDAVITCATDFSYSVACIREALGIAGISVESAQIANYKHIMREKLSQHNISIPQYYILDLSQEEITKTTNDERQSLQEHMDLLEKHMAFLNQKFGLGSRVVVKPADNMGARGIFSFVLEESTNTCIEKLNLSLRYSRKKILLIEEYIEGAELSIDSFVQDGVLYPLGIADRHINFFPYFIETGHSIPSQLSETKLRAACKALEQSAAIAGIENGMCKGDIIMKGDQPYICEFAARLSGGYMSGWTIPYSHRSYSGLNPTQIAIKQSLGIKIPIDPNYNVINTDHTKQGLQGALSITQYCLEKALLMLPGILEEIQIDESLYTHPSFQNIFLRVEEGKEYFFPYNNTEKAGNIIFTVDNQENKERLSADLLSKVFFKIKRNQTSESFLFKRNIDNEHDIWRSYKKNYLEEQEEKSLEIYKDTNAIPVYIPQEIYKASEIGTWTHCRIADILDIALAKNYIREVPTEEESVGSYFWRAVFRAGWQGLYYFLDIREHWGELH